MENVKTEDDFRYITLIYHKESDPKTGISMIFQIEKEYLDKELWDVVDGFIDIQKDEIIQAINRKLDDDHGKCIISNAVFTKTKPKNNIFIAKNNEVEQDIRNSKEYLDDEMKGPRGNEERQKQINNIKKRMTEFDRII